MALIKVKAKLSGHCGLGARHVKGKKGCYRSTMGSKGKKRK